jgi:hypothetical protein
MLGLCIMIMTMMRKASKSIAAGRGALKTQKGTQRLMTCSEILDSDLDSEFKLFASHGNLPAVAAAAGAALQRLWRYLGGGVPAGHCN